MADWQGMKWWYLVCAGLVPVEKFFDFFEEK